MTSCLKKNMFTQMNAYDKKQDLRNVYEYDRSKTYKISKKLAKPFLFKCLLRTTTKMYYRPS